MKKSLYIWLLFGSLAATAQHELPSDIFHSSFEYSSFIRSNPIQIMLAANPQVDTVKYSEYMVEFEEHVTKLRKKIKGRSLSRALERTFYFNHRRKLSWYHHGVILSDLFESGKYDCLTGTAFYAATLEELGIAYQIYEFNYHVFLIVQTEEGRLLIEPTDPLEGFVSNQKEIEARIASYSQDEGMTANLKSVSNVISLKDLAGLHYYNMGITAYNARDYANAFNYLLKANFLYPSTRIKEIQRVFKSHVRLVSSN